MASIENDINMVGFEESDYEDDDDSFMMIDEENMAPVAKKPASKGKKAANKKNSVLSQRNNNAGNEPAEATEKGTKKTKTIEETYQKKTQLEHILIRPDTYIGSTEPLETEMFIYDSVQDAIVNKTITYTPGLYKIFDESKYIFCSICSRYFPRGGEKQPSMVSSFCLYTIDSSHSEPFYSFPTIVVIVNAADNKQRDPNMDKLDVTIDEATRNIQEQ